MTCGAWLAWSEEGSNFLANSSLSSRGLASALPRPLRFGGSEGPRAGLPAPLFLLLLLTLLPLLPGCASRLPPPGAERAGDTTQVPPGTSALPPISLSLVASTALTTDTGFPALGAARFGGISGCAWDHEDDAVWVVSDDRTTPRLFRVDIEAVKGTLSVVPRQAVDLSQGSGADDWPPVLDLEAIALDGPRVLVASEGDGSRLPRVPPTILAFTRDGRLLGRVALPEHVVPEPAGEQRRGVRANRAFESLALLGGDRLVTATEGPLAQDADGPGFDRGARVRWLTFRREGHAWRYEGDFTYDLDPISQPEGFGPSHAEAGLVDVLGLGPDRALALERAFVREAGGARRATNHIEIFDVTVPGATGATPLLEKRRVIDLAEIAPRLVPRLRNLDNFEAMCLGPTLADGARTVLLISDNNFNARQTTGFVLLRLDEGADTAARVAARNGTPPPLRVHIDTDAGPDDLAAIAFLLARPDVDVTGISLVEGVSSPAAGRWRVARLLVAAGRPDVSVGLPGVGRPVPPRRFPLEWRLDDESADEAGAGVSRDAGATAADAQGLLAVAFARGDRVLAIGPLTNVAAALAANPRGETRGRPPVTVMGGAIAVGGNVAGSEGPGRAEWNIYADPEAAAVVMARAAVTLVPLDATNQVPLTRAFVEALAARRLTPLGRLAVEWLSVACPVTSCHDVYAWDQLAAVVLVEPRVRLDEDVARIDIVARGGDAGRTVARGAFTGPHRIVRLVDPAAFTRVFVAAFDSP